MSEQKTIASEKTFELSKVSVEYMQDADSMSTETQFLELSTENAGGGSYFILKTERWAFDNTDELISVLNDFRTRILELR
jgi:hypothetical protein